MRDEGDGTLPDGPGAREAVRKLSNLLAGHYLLYEVTADREMRVLRLPSPVRRSEGTGGPPSRTATGGGPPPR